MTPRFCIQKSLTSKAVKPCSVSRLLDIMASDRVQDICDQIRLLSLEYPNGGDDYEEEKSRLKRQLTVITPHAQSFKNNVRKNENAVPSGLAMLDVDDVDDPHSLAPDEAVCKANEIYLVHITASSHGLRIIGQRKEGESIAQSQARLARLLGISTYDGSTKDLARTSFVVPRSYVLYMDESGLEFPDEAAATAAAESRVESHKLQDSRSHPGLNGLKDTPSSNQPGAPLSPYETAQGLVSMGSPESPADDGSCISEEVPTANGLQHSAEYHGIPYSSIVSQLISLLGGTPEQGERNTFYFTLVRYIRYICDFNAATILSVLPDFGLSVEERQQVVNSAINRPRKSSLPDTLQRAISMADCERDAANAGSQKNTIGNCDALNQQLPKLPRVLQIICKRLPAEFRPAMVIAALPVLGTLATRVRFDYLDHQEHSFSFMAMITAPAATGKSFIRRPVNLLLTPIDEQDAVEREKEQDYKDKLRAAKNAKQQPENPRACPRNNGINISIAKLLQLLSYSEGKHLIGIGEEIDTLLKSEKAGVWSQKSDIYRLAFDNAHYGQNYMSDNSFSANVPVYYNLLLTGTPNGMYRFFRDVEDGLVTRWAFAQLPDMFGTDIPEFVPYTESESAEIIRIAQTLCEADGKIRCKAVDDAISQWLQEKKQLAIANDSRSIDTLRRRAAVMGFRAGYLAALLNGSAKKNDALETKKIGRKKTKSVEAGFTQKEKDAAEFAVYIAEYVFRNQFSLFGDKMEQASNEWLTAQEQRGSVRSLLSKLPDTFTRSDLMTLRAREGKSTDVRVILSRWVSSGFIKKNKDGNFSKILANCI